MKRLVLLATILTFVLGVTSMASAATMKASGEWALEFLFSDNFDMSGADRDDSGGDFNIYQRARTQFDFIANENLKGVLATEIGTTAWGQIEGFHFHDHNTPINVRRAYLDLVVPDTKIAVRGGLQGVALPNAFGSGNIVLDDDLTALVVSTPIADEVNILTGYGRLYDMDQTNNMAGRSGSAFDAGILALPVSLDGFTFAPYVMYGYAGQGSIDGMLEHNTNSTINVLQGVATPDMTNNGGRKALWAGTSFTMTYFDPLKVMADLIYGNVSSSQGDDNNTRSGWMADLAVDYTGLDCMTPEVFFAYTSGDDNRTDNGSERLPTVSSRSYGPGSFWFANDSLLNGSKGYNNTQTGYWLVGLSLKDISFIEKLSHTVTGMYIQGTNDKAVVNDDYDATPLSMYTYGMTLTEEDHIVEFDLNNKYQLYDELALTLDFGYIANGYDKNIWDQDRKDGYKMSTGLLYQF